MCGLDNEYGIKAPYYSMEDGSVMSIFKYRKQHQGYPGRVHGGLVTAMLDEMSMRALWAEEGDEKTFGVTFSLENKYRMPVPYDVPLIGRAKIVKDNRKMFVAEAQIMDENGKLLSNATVKYMKLNIDDIVGGALMHEEMCYLIDDDLKEIDI